MMKEHSFSPRVCEFIIDELRLSYPHLRVITHLRETCIVQSAGLNNALHCTHNTEYILIFSKLFCIARVRPSPLLIKMTDYSQHTRRRQKYGKLDPVLYNIPHCYCY